jgi:hypothetical protein
VPPSIQVAILAHSQRPILDDLIENVHLMVPGAEVAVFNGGTDSYLTDGVDADVCPYSRPLKLGNLVHFQWGIMRWLREIRRPYDFLVTLDSDMLVTRRGFADYLDRVMAESEFMGAYYRPEPRSSPESSAAARINHGWRWWWQRLFGTDCPSFALNPGMVFRREYTEKALRFANTRAIVNRASRSRIYGIEEFVYPTLAVTLGSNPISSPGSWGIGGVRTLNEIRWCIGDPNVFLLHKVRMELGTPERRIIREIGRGREPDLTPLVEPEPPDGHSPQPVARPSLGIRYRERLKDAYFYVLP